MCFWCFKHLSRDLGGVVFVLNAPPPYQQRCSSLSRLPLALLRSVFTSLSHLSSSSSSFYLSLSSSSCSTSVLPSSSLSFFAFALVRSPLTLLLPVFCCDCETCARCASSSLVLHHQPPPLPPPSASPLYNRPCSSIWLSDSCDGEWASAARAVLIPRESVCVYVCTCLKTCMCKFCLRR